MPEFEHMQDAYAYALGLTVRVPDATAIGIAFHEDDGVRAALAVAVTIFDSVGEPFTGPRMLHAASRSEDDLRHLTGIAAIRAVGCARRELARALDAV